MGSCHHLCWPSFWPYDRHSLTSGVVGVGRPVTLWACTRQQWPAVWAELAFDHAGMSPSPCWRRSCMPSRNAPSSFSAGLPSAASRSVIPRGNQFGPARDLDKRPMRLLSTGRRLRILSIPALVIFACASCCPFFQCTLLPLVEPKLRRISRRGDGHDVRLTSRRQLVCSDRPAGRTYCHSWDEASVSRRFPSCPSVCSHLLDNSFG